MNRLKRLWADVRSIRQSASTIYAKFGASRDNSARPDIDWDRLYRRDDPAGAQIDVIMPVYVGRHETLQAIACVLASSNRTPHQLIVINDRSPDATLTADLERLAQRGLFTLLTNPANAGFVATVNRGMRLHPERDVILLNSDTEVFHDWIDRLRAASGQSADISSVTPLSNAATILSYPIPFQDNHQRLEISPAQLDALSRACDDDIVEIPTAVGFCMYIRRASLDQIGLFDEKTFGLGYGEENDFCLRARKLGWRHVAAPNVYVQHHSGTSFGSARKRRMRTAIQLIEALYPGYQQEIASFIAADPLKPYRARLDRARAEFAAASPKPVRSSAGRND